MGLYLHHKRMSFEALGCCSLAEIVHHYGICFTEELVLIEKVQSISLVFLESFILKLKK